MAAEVRQRSDTGGEKAIKLSRFDLIPHRSLELLAEHFGKGAKKYEDHLWRNGYPWSWSYNSMLRHQSAFWQGYDFDVCSNEPDNCVQEHPKKGKWEGDPDTCWNHTGSHHMVAVMWHSAVLLEFIEQFPGHDDRYILPKTPQGA